MQRDRVVRAPTHGIDCRRARRIRVCTGTDLAREPICDLVQIRSTDQGTTVRAQVRAANRATVATSE